MYALFEVLEKVYVLYTRLNVDNYGRFFNFEEISAIQPRESMIACQVLVQKKERN